MNERIALIRVKADTAWLTADQAENEEDGWRHFKDVVFPRITEALNGMGLPEEIILEFIEWEVT